MTDCLLTQYRSCLMIDMTATPNLIYLTRQNAKQQTDDQLQLWQFEHNIQVRHLADINWY
jgi:hypothetical protein